MPVIRSVICDHAVTTKYFYGGEPVITNLTQAINPTAT